MLICKKSAKYKDPLDWFPHIRRDLLTNRHNFQLSGFALRSMNNIRSTSPVEFVLCYFHGQINRFTYVDG